MNTALKSSEDLWKMAMQELKRSNADVIHPFRQMIFGTIGLYPHTRTVIKRTIDERLHILFYSDSRAQKVVHIRNNPNSSIIFYHPGKMLQIRMLGKTKIHSDGSLFDTHFEIACQNSGDYNSKQGPGEPIGDGSKGHEMHFCLLEFVPEKIDILLLQKEGHIRAAYETKEGCWDGKLLTP